MCKKKYFNRRYFLFFLFLLPDFFYSCSPSIKSFTVDRQTITSEDSIKYRTTGNPQHQFDSLGPRIPGIIVSPFVKQGSSCDLLLDHTSVLQFLAENFTPGTIYNQTVDNRKVQGIDSITAALTNEVIWQSPAPPSQPLKVSSALGDAIATTPTQPMAQSFENAALELIKQEPGVVNEKYPELLQWKKAVDNART